MHKHTVFGLPLNPSHLLEQLKGHSFCVSYGTRQKLGKQLTQAIRLVGDNGVLLVDNGAFSAHQSGVDTMSDESYLNGFADWANDILARCPVAVAVIPDVIGGTVEQNAQLIDDTICMFDDMDRLMPIWHMHEPISFLVSLVERFGYIGIGSSGEYFTVGSKKWHARMTEAMAAVDATVAASEGCIVRPRIHLMRGQKVGHLYDIDSTDSVNVAMNHNRQLEKSGETLTAFVARVDDKIQASAGPATQAQLLQPLGELHTVWRSAWMHEYMGFKAPVATAAVLPFPVPGAELEIPEFLRRAA